MPRFLLLIPLACVFLLAGCFNSAPEIARDVAPDAPTDVAETPIGTFKCKINTDCPSDQWCYVTKDFAACTKK